MADDKRTTTGTIADHNDSQVESLQGRITSGTAGEPDNNQTGTLQGKTTSGTTEESKDNQVKTIQQKITRPMELILLFWVNENDSGTKMFAESAQTRMQNIKKSSWYDEKIHKIHCSPIQAFHEIVPIIKNWTDHYGGKDKITTREIGLFSHAASIDGPITYDTANDPPLNPNDPVNGHKQMAIPGGWDAIDFNWKSRYAMIVFYGCNSGHNRPNGFAKKLSVLSNFQDVTIWGQSNFSFPSFFPDYRVIAPAQGITNIAWDVGHTYMVGDDTGKSWDTVLKGGHVGLSPDELKKNYTPADPFYFFINGNFMGASHQGIFNDHR